MQRQKRQMKEHENSPEKEQNEMEANKIPDTEFKTIVIKMLNKLSENFKELGENLNSTKKDKETIKKEPVRNEGHIN